MPHLVFIGGGQRSGTTLVQTVIANLLSSHLLPEAHVLFDIIASYKRARLEFQKNLEFFDGFPGIRKHFSSSVDLFINNINENITRDSYVVFKDPNFSTLFDHFSDVVRLPFTRILVVRDPRDIASSFISIGLRDRQEGTNSKYAKRNIAYICEKINKSYERHLNLGNSDFEFIVFYEELVISPAEALKGVLTEFGIEEDTMAAGLSSIRWLPSLKLHKPSWVSNLEGGPISPDSVGVYNDVLTAQEIELVQIQCAALFERFGYKTR